MQSLVSSQIASKNETAAEGKPLFRYWNKIMILVKLKPDIINSKWLKR